MTNLRKPQPSQALAEAHARDMELGIDPFAVEPDPNPPALTSHEVVGFWIEKPDWEQEEHERLARERQEKERALAGVIEAELERIAREDDQTYPAAPRRRSVRDLLSRDAP